MINENFKDNFLVEIPKMFKTISGVFEELEKSIIEKQEYFNKQKLSGNFYKMEGSHNIYFWFENQNEIIIGCELVKKPNCLIVGLVGKNSKYKNNPPFASDLYLRILKYQDVLRLESDDIISWNSLDIWKKLSERHLILAYHQITQKYEKISNKEEFEKYLTRDFKFVFVKDKQILGDVLVEFDRWNFRKNAGLL